MSLAKPSEYEENAESLCRLLRLNNIISPAFRVRQVRCSAGSNSGDNYMSVVKRVQISGRLDCPPKCKHENHLGEPERFSLIVKRQIASRSRRQLYRCDEAFNNEIHAYKYVVPLLERYTQDVYFPKCYFAGEDDAGELIVLEDLKERGYRMQNRLAGLELNYCELVMKQLAQLHAASIAAKQLDAALFRERRQQIREIVYCPEAEELYRNMLETSIQESLHSLRASNVDGCLSEPIRLIERLQTTLFGKIQQCITNSKESLSVMCHGDLWVNNIMFIHTTAAIVSDANNSRDSPTPPAPPVPQSAPTAAPSGVQFFDLQAMRYASPVFDILHFIYTSTKSELREAYTKTLLETYSAALAACLETQLAGATATPQLDALRDTFSLRNITDEYYAHVLYGLAISMWILPAVTFDPNNLPNLDAMSEMNTSAKEIKCTQKLTTEYHTRVKELALEFYQNGYLNGCLADEASDGGGGGPA